MRLALVHKRFHRVGGAESDCYESARQLAAQGHEVHVVAGERRSPVPPAISFHKVPVLRTGQTAKLLSFALFAPRVWRRLDADVVIGFGRTVGHDIFRASGGCHRRYLEQLRRDGGAWRALRQRLSPYHRAMLGVERRQYAAAGHRKVLTVSALARREILDTYAVDPAAVAVLPYGVDVERFHPRRRQAERAPARAALGLADDRPVALFVGTGFRRKGLDVLLRIWRAGAPAGAALVVVGDDQHLARYRRQARELPGPVVLTGPRADVATLYAAADLFVLPSRYDAFGMVVLEALASGLPVVATRGIGAAELLTGPLEELVVDDPDDDEGIARCIRRGVELARSGALAATARGVACAASLSVAVDRLEAWCRRVAEDKRG